MFTFTNDKRGRTHWERYNTQSRIYYENDDYIRFDWDMELTSNGINIELDQFSKASGYDTVKTTWYMRYGLTQNSWCVMRLPRYFEIDTSVNNPLTTGNTTKIWDMKLTPSAPSSFESTYVAFTFTDSKPIEPGEML